VNYINNKLYQNHLSKEEEFQFLLKPLIQTSKLFLYLSDFIRARLKCSKTQQCSVKAFEKVIHPKSAEERRHISEIVSDNILFKSLDEKQHEILLDAMFPKEFEAGDVIIKQGDDGDNYYILDTGVCEVYKDGVHVLTCTESMSFGELALMYNAPRAATVKAKEKSKVWALDRQTFKVSSYVRSNVIRLSDLTVINCLYTYIY
jgi:hypothetical protein